MLQPFRLTSALGALLLFVSPLHAQSTGPSPEQLESWLSVRKQRVDLLRGEIKQIDTRIEARLDLIVDSLSSIADSKDSRTKVARMKEDTMKGLKKTIDYYDQKRATFREELRNPQTALTAEDKQKIVNAFSTRIEKRTKQILKLSESMPEHREYERYKATGSNWSGTTYELSDDYEQNRRMMSHSGVQRRAIVKQLDDSIARLNRMGRDLRAQLAATTDPAQQKERTAEIARNDALIAERQKQKVEVLNADTKGGRSVGNGEANDLSQAMKKTIDGARADFTTLFQRYNSYVAEMTQLRATEKTLAAARAN